MDIALISKIKYLEYNSLYFGFFFFFNYIELLRKPILYNSTPALSLKMIVKNNFQKFEYHNQRYILKYKILKKILIRFCSFRPVASPEFKCLIRVFARYSDRGPGPPGPLYTPGHAICNWFHDQLPPKPLSKIQWPAEFGQSALQTITIKWWLIQLVIVKYL